MANGNRHAIDANLNSAFEAGYSNAASTLSQVIQHKVSCNNMHHSFISPEMDSFNDPALINRSDLQVLITTDVFGDVAGKSYLLLNNNEFEFLTSNVKPGKTLFPDIKIEFIKELDNMLSAAVITKLSNHLGLKMYGDIPRWVGPLQTGIADLIRSDFNEETATAYLSSAYFSVEEYPHIHLPFIWVMHGRIMEPQITNLVKL